MEEEEEEEGRGGEGRRRRRRRRGRRGRGGEGRRRRRRRRRDRRAGVKEHDCVEPVGVGFDRANVGVCLKVRLHSRYTSAYIRTN